MKRFFILVIFGLSLAGLVSAQEKSVFDFQEERFREPLNLDGKWDFFWSQFIESGDYSSEWVEMQVPSDWYDEPNVHQFPRTGYASYRTTLLVSGRQDLGLYISHIFSSYKLIINGSVAYESGRVKSNEEEYFPYREPKVIALSDYGFDEFEIIIQVANFDHMNSGMHYSLVVGEYDPLLYDLTLRQDVNLFLAGGLFITGFVLLAFAFSYQQLELQIPFYALFSISLMYRMLGADPYPIHVLFINFPFRLSIHLEYISIHSAALFGGLFVFYMYPRQTNKYLKYLFVFVSLVSMASVLILEPIVFTGLLKYYLFFVIFYVAIFIFIIAKAKIQSEATSGFLIFALVVVLLWTVIQIATFLDVGKTPYYLNVVLMSMIVVFCNLALFRTFMLKIQSADQAQAELTLNKAKQTMLSLISHEIKTPVATLRMNIEMLKAAIESGKNIPAQMMEKIAWGSSEAVIDIKQMVNDFVYFMSRADTRVESIKKEHIARRIQERFSIPEEQLQLPQNNKYTYKTDLLTLEYIVSTLLSNAEKYSSAAGQKPEINMKEDGGLFTIEVKDYGIGMNKEQVENLGKSKLELNEKSEISGVGFYLAKELSNQLGHNLVIKSKPGVGTSVRIELKGHD